MKREDSKCLDMMLPGSRIQILHKHLQEITEILQTRHAGFPLHMEWGVKPF